MNRLLHIPLFLMLCFSTGAQGKLCNGSLGENIFEEGDFGSGPDLIYPKDPKIAPGYTYTGMMPLPDGFYTLTNNIARWYANWPTWLEIRDNSPDPNGYMMVVNASYEPGIFYTQVIDDVCENTTYEFSADVINLIRRRVRNHGYPNISFLIDGKEKYRTGRIRQDEEWHRVGFTFQTGPGQSRVRLTLRNNAPGGTGNDLALDNISFRACGPYASVISDSPDRICKDVVAPVLTADLQDGAVRYIQWQVSRNDGLTWSDIPLATTGIYTVDNMTPGRYQYRFVHAATPANLMSPKCRAVSEVYTLEIMATEYSVTRTIERGKAVRIGDSLYYASGAYRQVLTSSNGCDSIINLRLIVEAPIDEPEESDPLELVVETSEKVICPGGSDGAVSVEAKGGTPPYSYVWSSGERAKALSHLGPGEYILEVTDARGQKESLRIIFTRSAVLSAVIDNIRPASFASTSDGTAEVTMRDSADASILKYAWDNGESGSKATALSAGRHFVTVTDVHGCSAILECDVPVRLIPELSAEALRGGEAVRIENLHFEADSSRINRESIPVLRELYYFLKDNPTIVIEVGGHTNGLPDHAYCDRLSRERAQAVAEWLVAQGIASSRIYYKGYGKRNPIATNSTYEGRLRNQRVEIKLLKG